MTASANSDDEQALAAYGAALAEAVERALPGWVARSVTRVLALWRGDDVVVPEIAAAIETASRQAAAEVGTALRDLLARDVDEQRVNPLTVVRSAVRYPTEVLVSAGVPAVVRDEQAERLFPDDVYGLTPASFADIDPALTELGITWGAAKAHVHLARRRRTAEG